MKRLIVPLMALALGACSVDDNLYRDPMQPVEKRVESLIAQMTQEEKLEQLNIIVLGKEQNPNNATVGSDNKPLSPLTGAYIYYSEDAATANNIQRYAIEESRLGIPVLLGHDVIHGYKTIFPIPLAQACSWSPDLAYRASRVAARESWLSGLRWTFSPMLDVARDGRWGRVAESYGEDPYANSCFAKAVVNGYQGENLNDKFSIAACLKHFAGYSYSEGGRDYHPTNVSDLSLWETVLPPFKAAVDCGAATVMSSFNDLNGVPTVANRMLLTEVLRERWGFEGFVVSDWRSVEQLITQRYAADSLDAAVKAIEAGNDMNMYDRTYSRFLTQAEQQGKVEQATIDEAVRRILRVKFELGLFDNPYTEEVERDYKYMTPESRLLAQRMAEESMVLLKNSDNILPLKSNMEDVLLVGAMAADRDNMMGTWFSHGQKSDVVTILDAMKREFPKSDITYLKGAGFMRNDKGFVDKLRKEARKADVVVVALGEQYKWSGENGSKSQLELPEAQQEVIREAKKYCKKVVLITSSGRPLALKDIEPMADAILHIWQPGLFGGNAVAGILSGRVNPSGRLAITFPQTTGQVPLFYNARANARSAWGGRQGVYVDINNEPLYEFGAGLSYSQFDYGKLTSSSATVAEDGTVTLSVEVTNRSKQNGYETLFWFVDDPVASITQPLKKLKHFEKRLIEAGKTERFEFKIDPMRDLSFVDGDGVEQLEKGDFYILVKDQRVKITLQ